MGLILRRNESIRTNPLSLVFLLISVVSIFVGLVDTGFLASYRLGQSIIPSELQLHPVGPYSARVVSLRNGKAIRFELGGEENYQEDSENFDSRKVNIIDAIERTSGKKVTYLWVRDENPTRKVWRIDVEGKTVFSYERALFVYEIDNNSSYSWFTYSILMFAAFLVSMFGIERK